MMTGQLRMKSLRPRKRPLRRTRRMRTKTGRVRLPPHIPDNHILFRKPQIKLGFEMIERKHPLSQTIPKENNALARSRRNRR